MKWWFIGAGSAFGLGLIAIIGISVFTSIGRSMGEEWGSLNGPAPVWPAAIGFGGLNLVALSGAVLVVLVIIAVVRAVIPARARDE